VVGWVVGWLVVVWACATTAAVRRGIAQRQVFMWAPKWGNEISDFRTEKGLTAEVRLIFFRLRYYLMQF